MARSALLKTAVEFSLGQLEQAAELRVASGSLFDGARAAQVP